MVGKSRNFGLDVVRAVSILLVLAAHRFTLNLEVGLLGVQIFFILSGFLIGQILLKSFKESGNLRKVVEFWKRRWYRTLPLYYLVLLFKILIYGNPFGWKMIVYFLFLQANFVGISFFAVSWSLVVEEWFYIFLPLATFVFFRKGIQFKSYFKFLISFILFFFAARFLWNYFHKGVIIYQFDCLLLGVLMALIKMYANDFYKKLNSFTIFLIGLTGTIAFLIMLGEISDISIYNTFYRVVWYFLVSFFISLMIPFVENSTVINTHLKKIRPFYFFITWTSILTYSIYLLHMEVFQIPLNHLPMWLNLITQTVILYLSCFVVFIYFEHPMLNLRDRFSLKSYIDSIKSFSFHV